LIPNCRQVARLSPQSDSIFAKSVIYSSPMYTPNPRAELFHQLEQQSNDTKMTTLVSH
jgi:hypothetical protein